MKIKNSKIGFLLILIFTISCGNVKRRYIDNFWRSSNPKRVLDYYKAHDSIYSILFFSGGFDNNVYIVKNGDKVIFDDKLKSDSVLGLADVIRIDNRYNVSITEKYRNFTFTLKSKNLKRYKYITISRDRWEKHPSFEVIFSKVFVSFR